MTKSQKAFRRAAMRRSKTAWLFCHIFIAMSIGRMMERIIRCQTCGLAAKSIEASIDFAIRRSLYFLCGKRTRATAKTASVPSLRAGRAERERERAFFHAFRLYAKKKCIETNANLQKTQRQTQPKKAARIRRKPCGANFSKKKKGQNG